jgi:hypothetical protein
LFLDAAKTSRWNTLRTQKIGTADLAARKAKRHESSPSMPPDSNLRRQGLCVPSVTIAPIKV